MWPKFILQPKICKHNIYSALKFFSCHLCDCSALSWRSVCWAGVCRFIFTYPAEYQSRLTELQAGPLQTRPHPSSDAWRPHASLWYRTHTSLTKYTENAVTNLHIPFLSLYRLWHTLWRYRKWPSVSFWRLYVIQWTLAFNTHWPVVFNARFIFRLLSIIQTKIYEERLRVCVCMLVCVFCFCMF